MQVSAEEDERTAAPAIQPPEPRDASSRVYWASILVAALSLRLLVVSFELVQQPPTWFFNKAGELSFLAQSILFGRGLSSPWGGATGPTAFLAPGYPAIIATIFRLFGSFTRSAEVATMLLQTLFGVLTVILVIRIAHREFGARAANFAGIFCAVELPLLWMPVVFWDSSLSILLLTAAIALALACARNPRQGFWAGMGIIGGFTLLVNPSLALTLLGLFAWTILQKRRPSITGPLLAVLLLLVIYAPWPVRNARVLHAFIPLRSNLGFELWKGNRPGAAALDDPAIYPVFNRPEFDEYATMGEIAYMRRKSTLAQQEIRNHPTAFIRLTADRFLCYWTGASSEPPSLILAAHAILTTFLAFLGLACLVHARRFDLASLFCLPLLLFPLPYYITHAEMRFRLIIEPVTILLAAYALTEIAAPIEQRKLVAARLRIRNSQVTSARRSTLAPAHPAHPAAAPRHPESHRGTSAHRTSPQAAPEFASVAR